MDTPTNPWETIDTATWRRVASALSGIIGPPVVIDSISPLATETARLKLAEDIGRRSVIDAIEVHLAIARKKGGSDVSG